MTCNICLKNMRTNVVHLFDKKIKIKKLLNSRKLVVFQNIIHFLCYNCSFSVFFDQKIPRSPEKLLDFSAAPSIRIWSTYSRCLPHMATWPFCVTRIKKNSNAWKSHRRRHWTPFTREIQNDNTKRHSKDVNRRNSWRV